MLLFLKRAEKGRQDGKVGHRKARALPYSALFSLTLPIPLLAPALVGASAAQIQGGFVIYLLTPALLIAFQAGGWRVIRSLNRKVQLELNESLLISREITSTYLIVGVASAIIHLGVLAFALFSGDPSTTISALYCPDLANVRSDTHILTTGALLFFQWDFIIVVFTVVAHFIFSSGCLTGCGVVIAMALTCTLLAFGFILGPGALLAYTMIRMEYSSAPQHGSRQEAAH